MRHRFPVGSGRLVFSEAVLQAQRNGEALLQAQRRGEAMSHRFREEEVGPARLRGQLKGKLTGSFAGRVDVGKRTDRLFLKR